MSKSSYEGPTKNMQEMSKKALENALAKFQAEHSATTAEVKQQTKAETVQKPETPKVDTATGPEAATSKQEEKTAKTPALLSGTNYKQTKKFYTPAEFAEVHDVLKSKFKIALNEKEIVSKNGQIFEKEKVADQIAKHPSLKEKNFQKIHAAIVKGEGLKEDAFAILKEADKIVQQKQESTFKSTPGL